MKNRSKVFALAMIVMMATASLVGCGGGTDTGGGNAVETQFVNIGTGGTAGTYFPLGG